jgi:hypothetical protein
LGKLSRIKSKPGCFRVSRYIHVFLLCLYLILAAEIAESAVFLIDSSPSDTARIKSILESYQGKISDLLDFEYSDTVQVVVASDIETFRAAIGGEFPDWGAAAAIKPARLIVIKSPASFQVGKSLDELLGHELAHLILDKASGSRWLPRWLEEGFCQMISHEWRLANDLLVTRAVWGGGLLPLASLEGVNSFSGAKASLAYAQSYLAFSSLVQEFGIEFIRNFLGNYRETGNFYGAFFRATGYSYSEWDDIWLKKTTDHYRMILFIFDPAVLFPLIAVLFILLYILKKYITWKKKKQWEAEERYRDYDQNLST